VVIVNWNSGSYLQKCLDSIEITNREDFALDRVVIVDNASVDDSMANLNGIHLPLIVAKNQENLGFAAACNHGAKESTADYILFLNPDIGLFRDSLNAPMLFMELSGNEKVAIIGIQLVDDSGNVSPTCARFPTPGRLFAGVLGLDKLFAKRFSSHFMKEWNHGETRAVDQVMGAFFLVRRSLFENLSGFDERFFVYFEDLDFSYRAYQHGYRSIYLATVQAYHAGGGVSKQIKAKRLFYSLRSRILYCYKHFQWGKATGVLIGTLLIEPFTRLVWAFARASWIELAETVKAYALLWRSMLGSLVTKQVWSTKK
jgi:GT2 family glycosyltransferase